MDSAVLAAIVAGGVALIGTVLTYLSTTRAGRAVGKAQESSAATEAQRVALDGLRELIEAQQADLERVRELANRLAAERDTERKAHADAELRLGQLELECKQARAALEALQARLGDRKG